MDENSPESFKRTWGRYPTIQKDFPYSDQCISALIAKVNQMAQEREPSFVSTLAMKYNKHKT